MRVKICGITNIDDALLCSDLGADALGFIFYNKSKRYVTYEKTAAIIDKLPVFLTKVGVFVNENSETINAVAANIGLNAVQLHGDETRDDLFKINSSVIKAFRVEEYFNWKLLENFIDHSILLDAYSQNEMGGTGKSFDWNKIPEDYRDKIILSGGITTDKLKYIFEEIKPAAIDLSSSLESQPGKKDHKKVKEFFNIYNMLRSSQC